MASRVSKKSALPRHGRAHVTMTIRDSNGFLHHFGDIDTSVGAVHEALAIMQLQSPEKDAGQLGREQLA